MIALDNFFRLVVIASSGRDREKCFPHGAGSLLDTGHLPVNFHAFAACTYGRYCSSLPERFDEDAVLLLIGRDMSRSEKVLRELKQRGKIVVISIKETGSQQIAASFQDPKNLESFSRLCQVADGALATTYDSIPLYSIASRRDIPVLFLPPPYPIEEWNLSSEKKESRSGIFLGTRQLYMASRLHPQAVMIATWLAELESERLTIISGRGSNLPPFRKLLSKWTDPSLSWHQRVTSQGAGINIIARQLPPAEYLHLMASHRIVFQLDSSSVPGQVAGDALLCRIPCAGGDGTAERLIFPDLCGYGRTTGEIITLAKRLLSDDGFADEQVQKALQIASDRMCFSSARRELASFFGSLKK
jgi:hypothetical protein